MRTIFFNGFSCFIRMRLSKVSSKVRRGWRLFRKLGCNRGWTTGSGGGADYVGLRCAVRRGGRTGTSVSLCLIVITSCFPAAATEAVINTCTGSRRTVFFPECNSEAVGHDAIKNRVYRRVEIVEATRKEK
ncbi:hypothetical protein CEXT_385831 [Caerostris extrusa]|uniref:Uncharacterized protein n=1 Tax=Caerostris extrusa TaxID=172846 RepID=A0AAV4Y263_CAEEX|nr:hypothetical protein CEXT_385831 [Caerostris extrusa]